MTEERGQGLSFSQFLNPHLPAHPTVLRILEMYLQGGSKATPVTSHQSLSPVLPWLLADRVACMGVWRIPFAPFPRVTQASSSTSPLCTLRCRMPLTKRVISFPQLRRKERKSPSHGREPARLQPPTQATLPTSAAPVSALCGNSFPMNGEP